MHNKRFDPSVLVSLYHETLEDIAAFEKTLPPDFSSRMARNIKQLGMEYTPVIRHQDTPLIDHDHKNKTVAINSCFYAMEAPVTKFVIAHKLANMQAAQGITIPVLKTSAIGFGGYLGGTAATVTQEPLLFTGCAALGGAMAAIFMSLIRDRHIKNDQFALNLYPKTNLNTIEHIWQEQSQEFKQENPIMSAFNRMLPDIFLEKISITKRIENMKFDQDYLIN